jgi:hypothetical protein
MKNNATIPNNTITFTMENGHVVMVEILSSKPTHSWMGNEYECGYLGSTICIDVGQNWFLRNGDKIVTHQVNIQKASTHVIDTAEKA